MSIFIPFNHQPANVPTPASSYTCPSGYYARAVATLSASTYFSLVPPPVGTSDFFVLDTNSDSFSIEIWLDAGDILTKSTTAASDTIGPASRGAVTSASTASLSVNSTVVAIFSVPGTGAFALATGTGTMTLSGYADVTWHIEEYLKLS